MAEFIPMMALKTIHGVVSSYVVTQHSELFLHRILGYYHELGVYGESLFFSHSFGNSETAFGVIHSCYMVSQQVELAVEQCPRLKDELSFFERC